MEAKPIKILLIEDSIFATRHTQKMLAEAKSDKFEAELKCADQLSEGLEHLSRGGFDIVLLDLTFPDSSGIQTFIKVRSVDPEIPIIVLSAFDDEATATRAVQEGAQDYLIKGWVTSDLLKRSILYALERKQIQDELNRHQMHLEELVERRTADLRKANEELCLQAAILANVSEGVYLIRAEDGIIAYANPKFEEIFGYDSGEMLGKHVSIVNAPTDKSPEETAKEITAYINKHGSWAGEVNNIKKDGSPFWSYASVSVFDHPEHGKVFVVVHNDITERKQAEESLHRSEASLAEAQHIAHIGNWDWNIVTGELFWSDEIYRIFGLEPHEFGATYDAFLNFVHPDDREHVKKSVNDALNRLKPYSIDHRIVLSDGKARIVHEQGEVTFDESGKPIRIVGIVQDITERKRAEDVLAQKAEELERSNAELEQFAYVASHDLQEPLRKIKSFTELFTKRFKGKIDEKADSYIYYIVDSAARMQQLINDLLSYSRVSTRGEPFKMTNFDYVLRSAIDNCKIAIKESNAEITHDKLPMVVADESQMIRILQNLIGNAIKFRGEDAPRIHVSAEEGHDEWTFSVRDNGIGIETQYYDRIFEIFKRLHGREEYPGSGIGLSICKRIMERHGSQIRVESEPGKGSTFKFALPKIRDNIEKDIKIPEAVGG